MNSTLYFGAFAAPTLCARAKCVEYCTYTKEILLRKPCLIMTADKLINLVVGIVSDVKCL